MLKIFQGRRDLTIAVFGRAASAFGDGIALVALILRLQGHGAPPYEIGLLMGAGGVPQVLLANRIGLLVDSRDSRQLLIWGGAVELVVTVPLIGLHAVVPVLILVAALGAVTTLTGTTWTALLPHLAGEDNISGAISAQQSLTALVLVAAPAAGGLLAGFFGAGLPLAIDAATFLVMTVAAALIQTHRDPAARTTSELGAGPPDLSSRSAKPDSSTSGLDSPTSGFAILRADQLLAPLLAGVAVVVLLVGMADVVLVFLVRRTLGAPAAWYGVIEAAWMAGMVGGSLGAGRIGTDTDQARATIAGIALTCAAVAGFAAAPAVAVLVPIALAGGIGNGFAVTCLSTLFITRTHDAARGRVTAAATVLLGGSQAAALFIGSCVAIVLSPREIYTLAGILGLGAAVAVAVVTTPGMAAAHARH